MKHRCAQSEASSQFPGKCYQVLGVCHCPLKADDLTISVHRASSGFRRGIHHQGVVPFRWRGPRNLNKLLKVCVEENLFPTKGVFRRAAFVQTFGLNASTAHDSHDETIKNIPFGMRVLTMVLTGVKFFKP